MEGRKVKVIIVNAQHVKNLPGRKTDVKDAEWLADLVRHGLVKASYIPNREQRELREITRYRQELVEERARELNRIQGVLEGANIKLASVITDISGKTGISILKAIISGESDSVELSKLAQGNVKNKIPLLQRALCGCIGEHQRQMLNHQVRHIEFMSEEIERLDNEILKKTEHAAPKIEMLDEIPGIGRRSAERIIAEIGIDMGQFENAAHFSSWAGMVPGDNKSAGKKKSTRIRKGNEHLKTTLVECAQAAIRKKDGFLYVRYKKIAARRGGKRAIIAVAHSMLVAIYHMLKNNESFKDLGCNYFEEKDKDKLIKRHVDALKKYGYDVALSDSILPEAV